MQKRRRVRYLGILLGCLISSSSINLFLVPSHLLSGGIAGIAIIFYYLAHLPIGMQMLVYNIPLLIGAYKTLGRGYTIDVIFGTVLFSICVDAMRFLGAHAPVTDTMLAAIYGGAFNGIGYGIIFRMHGSSGGLDIVAAIVKKYYSFDMGGVIFAFNCIIMGIAAMLFGVMPAMFTLISMFVSSAITDKVIAGFNRSKMVVIISDRASEIADLILEEIDRGVTFLKGEGAFTHREKEVLFAAVNLTQISQLKSIVRNFDKKAFMIILDASEVSGRGFTFPGSRMEALMREKAKQGKDWGIF